MVSFLWILFTEHSTTLLDPGRNGFCTGLCISDSSTYHKSLKQEAILDFLILSKSLWSIQQPNEQRGTIGRGGKSGTGCHKGQSIDSESHKLVCVCVWLCVSVWVYVYVPACVAVCVERWGEKPEKVACMFKLSYPKSPPKCISKQRKSLQRHSLPSFCYGGTGWASKGQEILSPQNEAGEKEHLR